MEDTKKIKAELTRMKTTVSKMKNTLNGTNGRSDLTKEKVSELEHTTMENIQNEMERKKELEKKKERVMFELWDNFDNMCTSSAHISGH